MRAFSEFCSALLRPPSGLVPVMLVGLGLLAMPSHAGLQDQWPDTDFSKRTVELDEIISGGPPRDGIPSIDSPKFESAASAAGWVHADEPVIALEIDGDARAYPLQILIWHEIVNDLVGGMPVSVTFCPLCNASVVFDRRLDGRVLDFGTTGRLRLSDMVMYDRQTESWWQQFLGTGIVGYYAGARLNQLPTRIVAFEDFVTAYPNGRILSRETGYSRDYGRNPYRGYDRIGNSPFLLDRPTDPRLPAMERVLAVSLAGRHRLYPFSALRDTPVLNDSFAGQAIVVISRGGTLSVLDAGTISRSRRVPSANAYYRHLDGRVLDFEVHEDAVRDRQTGSRWNLLGQAVDGPLAGRSLRPAPGGVHFAFAWLAFVPDSSIYGTTSGSDR